MPTSPSVTVTATAPKAATSAGSGSQANGKCIKSVTISQPASDPLNTPNTAVAVPSSAYSMV